MSEQYNVISVFPDVFRTESLAQVLMGDLGIVWNILGPPSELVAIDVQSGLEDRRTLSGVADAHVLKYPAGTIVNIRGTHRELGTVQYYEALNRSVISVSRPFDLLPLPPRLNWVLSIWNRMNSRRAQAAIAGRELDLSDSSLKEAFGDWLTLKKLRLAEYLILAAGVAPAAPVDAIPLDNAFLFRLLSDDSGGKRTN